MDRFVLIVLIAFPHGCVSTGGCHSVVRHRYPTEDACLTDMKLWLRETEAWIQKNKLPLTGPYSISYLAMCGEVVRLPPQWVEERTLEVRR